MRSHSRLRIAAVSIALLLAACEFDFPLTAPTRTIEWKLVGAWTALTPQREWMNIRQLDETHYIVVHQGELYRVHHSDAAGMPLLSAEHVTKEEPGDLENKWMIVHWELDESGKRLTLKWVNTDIFRKPPNREEVLSRLESDRNDPSLFAGETVYKRND